MQLVFWKKMVLASLASSLVVAAMSLTSIGQEAKKSEKAKPTAKQKAKGRLPAYYKDVVTDQQRDQIYTIQAKYEKQLADLRAQIETVQSKQNEEIEALLSAEQKEKLAKVREEADAKKNAAKTKKTDDAKPADAAKTTTESPKKTN